MIGDEHGPFETHGHRGLAWAEKESGLVGWQECVA